MDYPRDEIMRRADAAIREYDGTVYSAEVNFKFTCAACGERCTLSEANRLYEQGECCECGHMTTIDRAGFSLTLKAREQPEPATR